MPKTLRHVLIALACVAFVATIGCQKRAEEGEAGAVEDTTMMAPPAAPSADTMMAPDTAMTDTGMAHDSM